MRSQLKPQALFAALIVVCALATGLQARPQEVTNRPYPKEPDRSAKESQGQPQEQRRFPKEPERKGQEPQPPVNDSAHAPEIDGSMIPTALALAAAGVAILRARLRSR